jgi:hypothetical protein
MLIETPEQTRRFEKAKRYLRLFMRDQAQLNRLTRKVEADDEMLAFAIEMAIDDWNTTTPLLSPLTITNYPSISMLMQGAAIQLLKSNGILQARNELSYNAGGTSFTRFNKSSYYLNWAQNLESRYELMKRNMKIQFNVSRGWGYAASEYERLGLTW